MALLGSAAAWPLGARAQQSERVRRIGVPMNRPESDPEYGHSATAFLQGLKQLGWTHGRNVRIDYRWFLDAKAPAAAAELLRLAPDDAALVLPACNSEAMQLHLEEIATKIAPRRARHSHPRSSRLSRRERSQGSEQHLALHTR